MDIELLLYENDKECDFMRFVGYYQNRIRMPKITNDFLFLQRQINEKLNNIYLVIVAKYDSIFGETTNTEYLTPKNVCEIKESVKWQALFKEHYIQQKFLHGIGWRWRYGIHSDPKSLEEVLELQKQFNKMLDEFKMETWLDLNKKEISFMYYAGYNYRSIKMDNQTKMKEVLFNQFLLNDDIKTFLINLIKDIGTDQPPVEYSHKDMQEYYWISWEDIFKQYRIKQEFMARIEQLWNLKKETIDNMMLENILKKQTFLIETLRFLKCDLAKVYKEMFIC